MSTIKAKVISYVQRNPGLSRQEYISDFMEFFDMTKNSASLYHYTLVTKPAREAAGEEANKIPVSKKTPNRRNRLKATNEARARRIKNSKPRTEVKTKAPEEDSRASA